MAVWQSRIVKPELAQEMRTKQYHCYPSNVILVLLRRGYFVTTAGMLLVMGIYWHLVVMGQGADKHTLEYTTWDYLLQNIIPSNFWFSLFKSGLRSHFSWWCLPYLQLSQKNAPLLPCDSLLHSHILPSLYGLLHSEIMVYINLLFICLSLLHYEHHEAFVMVTVLFLEPRVGWGA